MGNSYTLPPPSNIQLSGGTLGMVKIADLFYIYNQTQQATMNGVATLQALAYTSTGAKFQSAAWYEDSTHWVNTATAPGAASGGTANNWYANGRFGQPVFCQQHRWLGQHGVLGFVRFQFVGRHCGLGRYPHQRNAWGSEGRIRRPISVGLRVQSARCSTPRAAMPGLGP